MKKKYIIIAMIALLAIIAVTLLIIFKKSGHRSIKIDEYSGSVDVEREEKDIEAYEGMQLVSEDQVTTYDESELYLLIDTDKYVGVKDNTVFSIESTGTAESGSIRISIENGGAVFKIKNKLNKDSTFEVSTPNAVMSVRGTKFEVFYDKKVNETKVFVFNGEVKTVYGKDGEEEIILKGDEDIVIRDDSIFAEDELTEDETEEPASSEEEETEEPEEESEEESEEDETSLIPPDKNFDNVTGFEGYWYDAKYGGLALVLFSDGTGWEMSDIDGRAHDITYEVSYASYGNTLTVIGEMDMYFFEIIDENTIRDDWDCIRKPYEGGLENARPN